jgi:hypothetical protein
METGSLALAQGTEADTFYEAAEDAAQTPESKCIVQYYSKFFICPFFGYFLSRLIILLIPNYRAKSLFDFSLPSFNMATTVEK